MRRHLTLACEGQTLVATLDEAGGDTGVLIVTGGNELCCGAFGGQAALAASLAAHGYPTLRFDRRGVGDSTGTNAGYRSSGPDIAAAMAALRREAGVRRVVAFGNCDAASALMLAGGAGADALVLANPWTFPDEGDGGDLPSPADARSRYARRLTDPRQILRLLRGQVNLRKLLAGLRQAVRPAPPATLLNALREGVEGFSGPVTYLVAGRDRTGQAFARLWKGPVQTDPHADHAFSGASQEWLLARLLGALEQADQLDVG